jgi:DNA polymerase
VRRALEVRAAIGSASVKKVFSMANRVSRDGRLRDLFVYHGARTGRVTGEGPQPTNLPNSAGVHAFECEACSGQYGLHSKACPWCGASLELAHKVEWGAASAESALRSIETRSLAFVEYVWGDAMKAVSGCLRALYIASLGKDLICSDYSSIEAVVIAELAGEKWRQDVFRTHGKIYEMSAAKITGIPFEEYMTHAGYSHGQLEHPEWWTLKPEKEGSHHPTRKTIGKVAELALGYQGWIGSMLAFGADAFMSEEQMKEAILAWREASPAIVELWGGQQRNWRSEYYGVEGAFVQAILYPGTAFECRGLRFEQRGDAVSIRLLSGRELTYHRPRLTPSDRRAGTYTIGFEGWNSNPKNGAVGWIRMETWGGRLVENIVQATARDIQWHGILALEAAGYPVVLHVYDEDVSEVPEGFGSVEEFERIMSDMPDWAKGWPIKARGGWRGKRYRK